MSYELLLHLDVSAVRAKHRAEGVAKVVPTDRRPDPVDAGGPDVLRLNVTRPPGPIRVWIAEYPIRNRRIWVRSRYLPEATISLGCLLAVIAGTKPIRGGSRQGCHVADLTTRDVDSLSKRTARASI
jgi:hypothetical protein